MFGTIVLAVDGSPPSDKAVDYAGRLAKESGSRIVAVHVKELMAGRAAGPVHVDEEQILEKVRGQVQKLADGGINAELQVTNTMAGGPAHVIADAAAKESADIIVTGTRGHTALAGVFLGSVAQRLLHLAGCPVLVIPDSSGAETGAAQSQDATTVT